jgi:hypothetical protein
MDTVSYERAKGEEGLETIIKDHFANSNDDRE